MCTGLRGFRCGKFLYVITFWVAVTTGCVSAQKPSLVGQGNQFAREGLLREAADSYKKEIAHKPENLTAHRNLGMVLVKMGDYKGAVRHLEKSMGKFEKDFDANYYLGEGYRAQDKYAEAIFQYKKALKVKSGDVRALKPLAWSYFKIRYYSEALAIARELQKAGPDDDQTAIITARTLLKLKRPKEALATISNAKRQIAAASRPYYNSVEGDVLYELNDYEGAARAYREALKEQPLLAGALLGLGRYSLDKGKPQQAITYMERAVRLRPRLTEAHYLLGKAYENIDRDLSLRYYKYFRRQASADPEFMARLNEVKERVSTLQSKTKSVAR